MASHNASHDVEGQFGAVVKSSSEESHCLYSAKQMDAPTCVLHVAADDFTSQVVQLLLEKARVTTFLIQRARSVGEAIALAHDTQFDVILLDLHLPDNVGLDALSRLKITAPSVPIIVLTGPDEDGMAIDAIRQGAQECLAKEHVMGGRRGGGARRPVCR